MLLERCDRMRLLTSGGQMAVAMIVLLVLGGSAAGAAERLPKHNPLRETGLPLPERNPVREAELPLPERNPVRETAMQTPERNPLRVVPEPRQRGKAGRWPKLLPGTPEILKTWTEEETAAERARCVTVLKDVDAEFEDADPVRNGGCGSAAPVKVTSIGKQKKVSISPPATMTCDLVVALVQWMDKDVQPAAQRHFGNAVTKISNISDYSCRNAYARTSTRLSEHALANALDIRDFHTEDGQIADLKRDWGPAARDIVAQIAAEKAAEAARRAAAAAEAAAKAAAKAAAGKTKADTKTAAKSDPRSEPKSDVKEEATPEPAKKLSPRELRRLKRAERRKEREDARAAAKQAALVAQKTPAGLRPVSASLAAAAQNPGPKGQFLREIHEAACGTFGTVLGPEANEAHRDHFHLDMAKRRYKSFCE